MTNNLILGIDIGGSGIKGAPVDVERGELAADRHRIPTPEPSTPDAVAAVVGRVARHFDWQGPVGATFPAVIKNGVAYTAANVDKSWIGANGRELLERECGCPVELINDADAAGVAEMGYGAGKGQNGTVMVLTFGTGIGSAMYRDGRLLPNTELGHVEFKGMEAEHYASDRVRKEEDLSWETWGERVNAVLHYFDALFSPDLFIIGGGVSKKYEKYFDYIDLETRVVPAQMRNEAGIIGAALAAQHREIYRTVQA